MTLVATIAAVIILAALLVEEVEKLANIFEALSTGMVRTNTVKKEEKLTWKEAYATR